MGRIHLLSESLIKKIAAGEVIERPASAGKELMENAIDAGATQLEVCVEEGGRSLIRVVDDGCGMSLEDLRLSVQPHATSKIAAEDDLYHIGSLGFRGEALASIGAVSRLRLVSRPHEVDEGGEIVVEGEQVTTCRAAGCSAGTVVEVRDLFFNVPARRKFLKNVSTEFGSFNTQFARIALGYPQVACRLLHQGRAVHDLPGTGDLRARIAKLYGGDLGNGLLPVDRDGGGLRVSGYASPPADARSNANWQFSFLNGRYVRDKFVQHAVKEAYRGLVDPHRFPVVFLFLSIDPAEVDANVHPTKIEVRWANSNLVHAQVLAALRDTLRAADLTPSWQMSGRPGGRSFVFGEPNARETFQRNVAEQFKQMTPVQPSTAFGPSRSSGGDPGTLGVEAWRSLYGQATKASSGRESPSAFAGPRENADDRAAPSRPDGGGFRAIQLHQTYLVCETDDGMVIIDQHALHERVLYEQLKDRLTRGPLEAQRLLLPETLDATPAQIALVESQAELLQKVGLEITAFGSHTLAVQSVPVVLKDRDAGAFARDVLDRLEEAGPAAHAELLIHQVLDMMACKAAVKAGDALTPEEIQALVAHRDLVDKSSNCPHGRPTTLRLTVAELERQFRRT